MAKTSLKQKKEEPILKSDTTYTWVKKDSPRWMCACGCSNEYPHSHLVAGLSCECEKGNPNLKN